MDEVVLTESRTLRDKNRDRVDALTKVGALVMLPDTVNATVEMAASYFEVQTVTIRALLRRHADELSANGMVTLRGSDLQAFKDRYRLHLSSEVLRSARLTLLPRSALLTVGQLLTESRVAEKVRRYLVALDATATDGHRDSALRVARLRDQADYSYVRRALSLGKATTEDYRSVQNLLYVQLFGQTAASIRATQPQVNGKRRKDGKGFCKSGIAKDHLTVDQLRLLDAATVMVVGQLEYLYPRGATAAQVMDLVIKAAALFKGTTPGQLAA